MLIYCIFLSHTHINTKPKKLKKSPSLSRRNISRTGALRPTSGPGLSKRSRNNTNNGVERHKSKLPRGMYINHDDIVKLASQDSNSRSDDLLTNMDREISTLLSQVR